MIPVDTIDATKNTCIEQPLNMLDAALAMAEAGLPVFPCTGKRPLTANGLNNATTKVDHVRAWWTSHPDAWIGLRTGAVSGLIVLDLDKKENKDGIQSLANLEEIFGKLPECPSVQTPTGGRHMYFAHPGESFKIKNSVEKIGGGIDVRGDGGYVIAPPSLGYRSIANTIDPPPLPQWLLDQVIDRPRQKVEQKLVEPITHADLLRAADALSHVDADCDYETWRDIGMALHHAAASIGETDEGFALWNNWSLTAPSRHPGDSAMLDFWRSFKVDRDNPITIGTLLNHAVKAGWTPTTPDASGLFTRVEPLLHNAEWLDPRPLVAKAESQPYPIDSLPVNLRAAIEEVQRFTQAPVALVASSALAALSVASQSYADVERANNLNGPTSLYLLTIADSGERKSTVDRFFTKAIHDYEKLQADFSKPALAKQRAALDSWGAKQAGAKEAIRRLAKNGQPTDEVEQRLHRFEQAKPQPVKVPRLLRGDETPENLAYALAHEWPSAGVVSSEAGLIFGAAGMGKEAIMRNLGLLNILWDGGTHSIGRRTSESFTVKGARLTIALQVQEPTLQTFFERSEGLARGTGFLARFLVAWPASTQGFRKFTEAPLTWPALGAFNSRISAILRQPAPVDAEGCLTPTMLTLTPEAKNAWVKFHDEIERQLAGGGDLYDVRDVASKVADNAVRIAALFHVFERGPGGAIGLPSFETAAQVARWHLNEAKRFLGEIALPAELADAIRMDRWLTGHCKREKQGSVSKRDAQRLGPVRDSYRLAAALLVLQETERVRMVQEGRRKLVILNPAILC